MSVSTQKFVAKDLATYDFLVPHTELKSRLTKLQDRLRKADIDLAIVQSNADLGYMVGSILDGWMLIPAEGEPLVLCRRAAERFQAETCWEVIRSVSVKQLVAQITAFGAERGRIAMTLDVTPAIDYIKLSRALPDAEFVDLTHDLRSVRAVKSAWELEQQRLAALQVQKTMTEIALHAAVGHSEIEIELMAESLLRSAGHQGTMRMRRFGGEMFFGQIVAGANAALPAALDAPLGGSGLYPSVGKGPSKRKLQHGDLLVLDLMGAHNGYLSDCTRVVAIGGVDAVAADLMSGQQWCVSVLEEIERVAKPGVAPSELYQLALDMAQDAGYADKFMGVAPDQARFVGHGIGVEVDEYPFLARGFDELLEPGMVFALEPKLVFAGRAAVGIEDAFVVDDEGVKPLPAVPREVLGG